MHKIKIGEVFRNAFLFGVYLICFGIAIVFFLSQIVSMKWTSDDFMISSGLIFGFLLMPGFFLICGRREIIFDLENNEIHIRRNFLLFKKTRKLAVENLVGVDLQIEQVKKGFSFFLRAPGVHEVNYNSGSDIDLVFLTLDNTLISIKDVGDGAKALTVLKWITKNTSIKEIDLVKS